MKSRLSIISRGKDSDPKWHESVSDGVKKAYAADPNTKQKMSERAKRMWQNAVYREKMAVASEQMRG